CARWGYPHWYFDVW
nr:immunoglobulin heavy chain junction region [Mus musculus]MBK4197020.1 immunoglobulin heavy chain junction region [Mus musculus]MBK4197021.1 immunoglobulin heavy chain junction region [Mus musculus]MBK4197022.1 immunoglobulin heavy chain junction region [Mus musculus]MBK4197023.1 immunoglobulin heavy chain junction region [Mus musculus]